MKLIRSRFRHDVDSACSVISILSGYRTGFYFEFLQRVGEWQRQRLIAVWIVMDSAVQQKCESVIRSAADRNDVGRIVSRSVLTSPTYSGARKDDELRHLTPIERQFHDAHIIDDLAHSRASRLDERRVRLDLDGLGNLTHLQHDVDDRIGIDLQHDSRLRKRTETRQASL